MSLPLWGKLLAFSVFKKVVVLTLAKVYGIPKLYRHAQHGVKLLAGPNPQSRRLWARRVERAFRLPDMVLAKARGLLPRSAASRAPLAWAGPLPGGLASAMAGGSVTATATAAVTARTLAAQPRQAATSRLRRLAARFSERVQAAQQRVRSAVPLAQAAQRPVIAAGGMWATHPFGSFAAQPLLSGAAPRMGMAGAQLQQMWHRAASLKRSVQARGREYFEDAALRTALRHRELKHWQQRALLPSA